MILVYSDMLSTSRCAPQRPVSQICMKMNRKKYSSFLSEPAFLLHSLARPSPSMSVDVSPSEDARSGSGVGSTSANTRSDLSALFICASSCSGIRMDPASGPDRHARCVAVRNLRRPCPCGSIGERACRIATLISSQLQTGCVYRRGDASHIRYPVPLHCMYLTLIVPAPS